MVLEAANIDTWLLGQLVAAARELGPVKLAAASVVEAADDEEVEDEAVEVPGEDSNR